MLENKEKRDLSVKGFRFWTPPADRIVEVGPEKRPVALPELPLPIHDQARPDAEEPSDDAIGKGLYDFLRQFPDCEHNTIYARLLRDAYSHYLADIGAQIVMLEHKEVDPAYIRRKISYMKILLLLDPENPGLLQRLGMSCYELALIFSELLDCRWNLLAAMGYLRRSLKALPAEPSILNFLAQIDYLLGDYPSAARRWQKALGGIDNEATRKALAEKVAGIEEGCVPEHPLTDDLEAVGVAIEHYAGGEIIEARLILERLEEAGTLTEEFSMPEFFYLLGMCRGRDDEPAGAFEAFDRALGLDPDFAPAAEGKDKILEEGRL